MGGQKKPKKDKKVQKHNKNGPHFFKSCFFCKNCLFRDVQKVHAWPLFAFILKNFWKLKCLLDAKTSPFIFGFFGNENRPKLDVFPRWNTLESGNWGRIWVESYAGIRDLGRILRWNQEIGVEFYFGIRRFGFLLLLFLHVINFIVVVYCLL